MDSGLSASVSRIADLRAKLAARFGLKAQVRMVSAGDIRTRYLCSGQGKPLILIHGAGGGGVLWGRVISLFSSRFQVFAPDLPGYGESDKPDAAYNKQFYSHWLVAFMNALHIETADLIGNSQGGAIALKAAADFPERVHKLVLASPAGFGLLGIHPTLIGLLLLATLFPTKSLTKILTRRLIYRLQGFPLNLSVDYLYEIAKSPGGQRALLNSKGDAVSPFSASELRRIGVETLIIWGDQDQVLPSRHGRLATRYLPNSQLYIMTNAGHTPFLDQPEAFAEKAMAFL